MYSPLLPPLFSSSLIWTPKVQICSSLEKTNIIDAWNMVLEYTKISQAHGLFGQKRARQNSDWLHTLMQESTGDKIENMIQNIASGHVDPVELIVRKDR